MIKAVLEQLIATGATDPGRIFDLALQIEREQYLKASRYERTPERRGYANGYREKSIDTHVGTVTLQVPETAGHEGEPFYPQSLERGRRSSRAVMPTVAGMYIKGTLLHVSSSPDICFSLFS